MQSIEQRRAADKAWRLRNPDKVRAKKARYLAKLRANVPRKKALVSPLRVEGADLGLLATYQSLWNWKQRGVTPVIAKEMLGRQENRCAICRAKFYDEMLPYLDHDHATGSVRGFLCQKCNSGIGMLKDDAEVVQRAVDYLRLYA